MSVKTGCFEGELLVPAIGGFGLRRVANELVGGGLPYPDNESEPVSRQFRKRFGACRPLRPRFIHAKPAGHSGTPLT